VVAAHSAVLQDPFRLQLEQSVIFNPAAIAQAAKSADDEESADRSVKAPEDVAPASFSEQHVAGKDIVTEADELDQQIADAEEKVATDASEVKGEIDPMLAPINEIEEKVRGNLELGETESETVANGVVAITDGADDAKRASLMAVKMEKSNKLSQTQTVADTRDEQNAEVILQKMAAGMIVLEDSAAFDSQYTDLDQEFQMHTVISNQSSGWLTEGKLTNEIRLKRRRSICRRKPLSWSSKRTTM